MASSTPAPKTGSGSEKKDPQVEELEKQTARVLARQKLVEAQFGAISALAPGLTDAPKNTVTIGEKAGSLAPWLAESVLGDVAGGIATNVWKVFAAGSPAALAEAAAAAAEEPPGEAPVGEEPAAEAEEDAPPPGVPDAPPAEPLEEPPAPAPALPSQARVIFVTDDADLLASDVVSRQVETAVAGRINELRATVGSLAAARSKLKLAVEWYEGDEEKRKYEREKRHGVARHVEVLELLAGAGDAVAGVAEAVKDVQAAAAAGAATTPAADGAAADPAAAAAGAGPIGAAIDLVKLLAVDYTVTSAEVSVDSALLARLTAGRLAATRENHGDQVLLDGVALADGSATLRAYRGLIAAVNKAVGAVQALNSDVAPVTAEGAQYQLEVDKMQEKLDSAVADKDAAPHAAEVLSAALDELRLRLTARRGAAEPAAELSEACEATISAVRQEIAALSTADAAGISPLQRACSRDRLHDKSRDTSKPVTHVLLVQATHAGADIVTRRSILGSSGRVGYLGGANGAWVMVGVDGTVVGGGAVESASQLTHDMTTGKSVRNPLAPGAGQLTSDDPLVQNEKWIRIGILILALALAVIGVAATLSVFL